jgi:hypothetical protein
LAQSAGHKLLDLSGWDAEAGGRFGLIVGNQRAGDIVAVSHAVFDGVGRRHPVAITIKQYAGEQARLVSAGARVALAGVARKLRLNRIPQRPIDDRRVFAGMGLALVNNLAAIEAVLAASGRAHRATTACRR